MPQPPPATPGTPDTAGSTLFDAAFAALMQSDPAEKCRLALALYANWQAGRLTLETDAATATAPPVAVPIPGRPAKPDLLPPQQVKSRSMGSPTGRAVMLHAIAHIEFNAINLALDAVYRFRNLPADYYAGWLQVAAEEAEHYGLIVTHLNSLGYTYGDFPAHNGLWDMACKTADDVLARMALVPRLFEARGLDVTPPIIAKFASVGDSEAVRILNIILRDEVGHVALGDRWFRHCCAERGLPAEATFLDLLKRYEAPRIKPPFNIEARLMAGFTAEEIERLGRLEAA